MSRALDPLDIDAITAPLPDGMTLPKPPRRKPGPKPVAHGHSHDHELAPLPAPLAVVPDPAEIRSDTYTGIDAYFHADRAKIVERYRTIPLDQVLFELSKLREYSNVAAEIANRRTEVDETHCWICDSLIPAGRRPVQIYAQRDPDTGTITNRFICSISCVREVNKKIMGWNGVPDRGYRAGEQS